MKTLNFDTIVEVYRKKNYPIDEMIKRKQVIITGIRMDSQLDNCFNDFLTVCYYNQKTGQYEFFGGMGTTEPGNYWLKNPMNVKGTFIMAPGFYKNCWTIGNHHSYEALVQVGEFEGWRDNDKDGKLPIVKENGVFDSNGNLLPRIKITNCGVNFHRALVGIIVKTVDKFSAGCQVVQNSDIFNKFMAVFKQQRDVLKMPYFSYGLFIEKDFQ